MVQKNKNSKTTMDKLTEATQQGGLLLMTAAVTLGMVEMPEHLNKVVMPNQPAFAFANSGNGESNADANPLRREREEAGPHYISYSTAQRTPGRTGKR